MKPMKIKVWPNGLGAEVTYKGRRISIQEQGRNEYAVAIRNKPARSGDDANAWYGKRSSPVCWAGLDIWSTLAIWGYSRWKHPSELASVLERELAREEIAAVQEARENAAMARDYGYGDDTAADGHYTQYHDDEPDIYAGTYSEA